ncbi:tyrosine-type recombinase/integrase [Rhodococcus ruber]|uniref:tyrosine-type recombinase/integrase n=1 Tax=Rhodococcus ruber TaxID=1830 RepID=UPI0011215D54|nr:site-specific integrase [Rhodococcus ruber]QDC12699.1 tyrosine-type recombinase/integrase [Rhodococcus ruber]QDC17434.1 tyrosine-type recombinase/integrase [Rhodococcus ruber]
MAVDSSGRALGLGLVRHLRPDEAVLVEMLTGWRNQQLARNLAFSTIDAREKLVRRFVVSINEYPWHWRPQHVDEFFGDLRAVAGLKQSSLRRYQGALRGFLVYLTDPAYGWERVCEELFGTHPVQVVHDWNSAVHVQEAERGLGKRAFSKRELQQLFDRADDEVGRIRALRRKGWWAAYRDAVLFKTAYAYGLRINEVRRLETFDFGRNPKARQFGGYGVLRVRHGKAMRGSPPKPGSVLTVFDWAVDVLEEWVEEIRPVFDYDGLVLFPSPRRTALSHTTIQERFRRYCDDLGFGSGLDFHSLRRSYVTHLIEDGVDPLFVQQQVRHEYASTTALYTCVSSDYRTRVLADVLASIFDNAVEPDRRLRRPVASGPQGRRRR